MRRFVLALVAMLMVAVAAVPFSARAQEQQRSLVRVIHAVPDAPPMDVYIDGELIFEGLPFFEITEYLMVEPGRYQVQVVPTGEDLSAAVINSAVTIEPGKSQSIAAINPLGEIRPEVLEDELSEPPAGTAQVRLFHLAPDAPGVDIRIAGANEYVTRNLEYPSVVPVNVPAGQYRFEILPAGSSNVIYTTPPLLFIDGWVYSVAAAGFLENAGSFAIQSRVDFITE